MNTEKIFIGYSNNYDELLLYRKDNNTYIDLLSDKNSIYPIENIDLSTLVLASNSLDLSKYMLQISIKRRYKKNREQLLESNQIILGDLMRVSDLNTNRKYIDFGDFIESNNWIDNPQYRCLFIYTKSRGDYKIYKDFSTEKELIGIETDNKTLKISKMPDFENGTEYIKLFPITLKSIYNQAYFDKKTIHEMANFVKRKSMRG